jgi:polyisoprenoid-binding protein YceI
MFYSRRMAIVPGTYSLDAGNGSLSVKTGRTGAAAKAGHDLVIDVTVWTATLAAIEDPAQTSIVLDVDPTSLRVREGSGGMQALGDDDKASIRQTIDDEVLRKQPIEFRSTAAQPHGSGNGLSVEGNLTLAGVTRTIAFELAASDDGTIASRVSLNQTDWEIKPYSTLFGALKVADEVEIVLAARLEL